MGDNIFGLGDFIDSAGLGISSEEVNEVAVIGREINLAVVFAPQYLIDRRLEKLCDWLYLSVGDSQYIKLMVVSIGNTTLGQILSDASETLGRAHYKDLSTVGREFGFVDEAVVFDQCIGRIVFRSSR